MSTYEVHPPAVVVTPANVAAPTVSDVQTAAYFQGERQARQDEAEAAAAKPATVELGEADCRAHDPYGTAYSRAYWSGYAATLRQVRGAAPYAAPRVPLSPAAAAVVEAGYTLTAGRRHVPAMTCRRADHAALELDAAAGAAGLAETTRALHAVVRLHAPVRQAGMVAPVCGQCSSDPDHGPDPWPCGTAVAAASALGVDLC